jgi:hypothetical protein
MRLKHNFAAIGVAFVGLGGLVGASGANAESVTVQVWTGDSEPSSPICTVSEPCEGLEWQGPYDTSSAPATIPVTFLEDSLGEVVTVTNGQIIVADKKKGKGNEKPVEFIKIKMVEVLISGDKVDPSSSDSFLGPGVTLSTLGPSEFVIELVNLTPSVGDQLVVDYAGSSVPEPSTWAMLLAGFIGLHFVGARRRGSLDSPSLRRRP